MRIISSRIQRARRLRDFGRIEAEVMLLVKEDGRPVPFERRILTSVPVHGPTGISLRTRLMESANELMMAAPKADPAAIVQLSSAAGGNETRV